MTLRVFPVRYTVLVLLFPYKPLHLEAVFNGKAAFKTSIKLTVCHNTIILKFGFAADGVPKEGLRIQDVLVRLAILHLIRDKVDNFLTLFWAPMFLLLSFTLLFSVYMSSATFVISFSLLHNLHIVEY